MSGFKTRERKRRSREKVRAHRSEMEGAAEIKALREILRVALKKASDPIQLGPVIDPETGKGKTDHGALWPVLLKIDRTGFGIWKVAGGMDLTDDERAMIVQLIERQ